MPLQANYLGRLGIGRPGTGRVEIGRLWTGLIGDWRRSSARGALFCRLRKLEFGLEKHAAAARARWAATPRTVKLGCDTCAHAPV